jgi:hypothetical protein
MLDKNGLRVAVRNSLFVTMLQGFIDKWSLHQYPGPTIFLSFPNNLVYIINFLQMIDRDIIGRLDKEVRLKTKVSIE